MKDDRKTHQLLLDYLYGRLHGADLRQLEAGLESSEDLRNRLEIVKLIEQSLGGDSLVHPSAHFTQRVMHAVRNSPAPHLISPKNGLMLLVGILIATGFAVALLNAGVFNALNGVFTFENLPLPAGSVPSIPFHGKWMVHVIVGLNISLAFILLDRTILKPLFGRRSRFQL